MSRWLVWTLFFASPAVARQQAAQRGRAGSRQALAAQPFSELGQCRVGAAGDLCQGPLLRPGVQARRHAPGPGLGRYRTRVALALDQVGHKADAHAELGRHLRLGAAGQCGRRRYAFP